MGRSLVIVESPAKAKTINKYLGKEYVVKSSVGHIRDLPTKSSGKTPAKRESTKGMTPEQKAARKKKRDKANLIRNMAIDPEHDWEARYEILPGKEKVLEELQKLAENADHIYLATDLDREGEAIAWHLREAIGGDEDRYSRVTFSEITKKAIQEAFADPGELNMDRVHAQQARRFLDRVVGFMLSPLLWKKVARGLSAGRVQSVAVRIVVEREREIRAFIPDEYWDVQANLFNSKKDVIPASIAKHKGETFKPTNEADTLAAVEALKAGSFVVDKIVKRPSKQKPHAPFITSTLQQAASVRMGFGVKKTMMMAQRLYEAGFITYMRTDSTNLSAEAVENCRGYIGKLYGDSYLPEKPNVYTSKEGAQEAHEAIRPSDVTVELKDLPSSLDNDAKRLYELIWRQFVSCQMLPAEFDTTTMHITNGDYEARARGRVMRFDGWLKVMPPVAKKGDENTILPAVNEGETLSLKDITPNQHFTKPPARYNEASLVKELEKRGIGRPSTYAAIIGTIQDRGYVRLDKKRFFAEKMGEIVTDRLLENFSGLMGYNFTAEMEDKLDTIAHGDVKWRDVLDAFYGDFVDKLADAEDKMRNNDPTLTDIKCEECGRPMTVRTGRTGVFLGCSGYSLPPKERCTKTMNLSPGEEAVEVDEDDDTQETKALQEMWRCKKCGTAMNHYLIDETRKLHICGNNPDCDGFEVEEGHFKIKGYDGPVIECDKCGKDMELKNGRFGKYFGCTAYPECSNTRKLLRNGEAAPPKADPVPMPELPCEKSDGFFILRDGAAGIFLASNLFPKSRETKNPLVEDLIRHKSELDPKFNYLLEAPVEDPDGRKAIIRFLRKTKEQYVMTEDDEGKASGWSAYYQEGKWVEHVKEKKPAKKKAAAKKKASKKKATTQKDA